MIGAVLASNPRKFTKRQVKRYDDQPRAVGEALGFSGALLEDASELYSLAWLSVDWRAWDIPDPNDPAMDAAAEALIRSGWLPPQGGN